VAIDPSLLHTIFREVPHGTLSFHRCFAADTDLPRGGTAITPHDKQCFSPEAYAIGKFSFGENGSLAAGVAWSKLRKTEARSQPNCVVESLALRFR
jgi:hypothetical protein